MLKPTRGDVVRQLDILRGDLRVAMTTIRRNGNSSTEGRPLKVRQEHLTL